MPAVRMTQERKREAAATAAAGAAMVERDTAGVRRRIVRLEGGISTISENARHWQKDGFPGCSATAWGLVEELQGRLRELDPTNEMLEVQRGT